MAPIHKDQIKFMIDGDEIKFDRWAVCHRGKNRILFVCNKDIGARGSFRMDHPFGIVAGTIEKIENYAIVYVYRFNEYDASGISSGE